MSALRGTVSSVSRTNPTIITRKKVLIGLAKRLLHAGLHLSSEESL